MLSLEYTIVKRGQLIVPPGGLVVSDVRLAEDYPTGRSRAMMSAAPNGRACTPLVSKGRVIGAMLPDENSRSPNRASRKGCPKLRLESANTTRDGYSIATSTVASESDILHIKAAARDVFYHAAHVDAALPS
jgi:hypothetical protein